MQININNYMATIKPVYSKIPQKGTIPYTLSGPKGAYPADATTDVAALHGEVRAFIQINGYDSLEDEDSTAFTVINAQNGKTITFTTDDGANYNQAPTKVDATNWTFGTYGADSAAKATQALHAVMTAAKADGALQMSLTPSSYTSESNFKLTQDDGGTSGHTAVTCPAGIGVNGGGSTASGNFAGGVDESGYDESAEAIAALKAGYADSSADAKKLEHARKVVLGYI